MAGPIYKAFMGRMTEAWYQLSQDEQNSLMDKVGAEKVGGKTVVLCNSAWSNEQWQFFGIEEYPDIETVQKATEALLEVDWYRYVDGVSMLGTRGDTRQEVRATGPIYKLSMYKLREAAYQLSEEEQKIGQAKRRENTRKAGGKGVLTCNCAWSTEQWMHFGVMEFPDVESAQKHTQGHLDLNHYRYVESMSILGTAWEG